MTQAKGTTKALAAALCAAALLSGALAPAASASPFDPTGALRIVRQAHAQLNTNQSTNWFGYNAGALERSGTLFSSVTSDWTVPTATQHTRGQAESSATWIGIGGGCLDAGCALGDPTLIQTGTEQDVDSSGHATYSAWWELVPAPATTIANFGVSPGDHVHASIADSPPNSGLWTITLKDVTRNESFSTTVPYPSTHSTAEWIEETPLTIGSGGTGEASLPTLSPARFDNATVNGAPARLAPGEQLQLVDASGKVIGTPSAPDAQANGFAACAWVSRCAMPVSRPARAHKRSSHRRHRSKRSHRRGRRRAH